MTDYTKMKVVDLKELLHSRNLPSTGKKDELIARLNEADATAAPKSSEATPSVAAHLAPPEDEIDWEGLEEDGEKPAATTGAGAAPPVEKKQSKMDTTNGAGETQAAVAAEAGSTPAEPEAGEKKKKFVFKRIADEFKDPEPAAPAAEPEVATKEPEAEAEKAPEEPKPSFAAGLAPSKATEELERRKARAARFGLPVDESIKTIERGLRFATTDDTVEKPTNDKAVKSLDQALGDGKDRGRKRGPEKTTISGNDRDRKRSRGDGKGPREQKGQNQPKKAGNLGILNDPVEKAKAEARAKKFGTA